MKSDQMQPPGQSLSFFFYEEWRITHEEHNGITGGERERQTDSAEAKVQINESWRGNQSYLTSIVYLM